MPKRFSVVRCHTFGSGKWRVLLALVNPGDGFSPVGEEYPTRKAAVEYALSRGWKEW